MSTLFSLITKNQIRADLRTFKAMVETGEQKDLNPNAVSEEMIDKTLADSFPASDPPSWTTGREHIDHEGADTEWNSAKSRRKNR